MDSPDTEFGESSVWSGLLGHADVREAFRRALGRGRLTQAYLFVGPEGIGKQQFARRLAQCLLCEHRHTSPMQACGECAHCRPFRAGTHPDFLVVERESGKRELAVAQFVGDREQRGKAGLCHDLSIRPVAGSRKIAIINDADTMTEEAANALLKTLEEPPDGAVLILIAKSLTSMLPTIRSRCQAVRFHPLSDADVLAWLAAQAEPVDADEARLLTTLAGGSLAAVERLSQPEFRTLRSDWMQTLAEPQWDGIRTARRLAESVDKLAADAAEQRQLVHWLLQATVEFYRSALRMLTAPQGPAPAVPEARRWITNLADDADAAVDLLGDLLERCCLATRHLDQTVGLVLCLESLCHDLAHASPRRSPHSA